MTKDEIYEELVNARDELFQLTDKMNTITRMVESLPDSDTPKPEPDIIVVWDVIGTPQPSIEKVTGATARITSVRYNGPDPNIAVFVEDANHNPLDGVDVEIGVEGYATGGHFLTGSKGPGLLEFTYGRGQYWVKVSGRVSDILHNASTNVDVPENDLSMTNGHLRIELTFTITA
jgi:hypothetical protein